MEENLEVQRIGLVGLRENERSVGETESSDIDYLA